MRSLWNARDRRESLILLLQINISALVGLMFLSSLSPISPKNSRYAYCQNWALILRSCRAFWMAFFLESWGSIVKKSSYELISQKDIISKSPCFSRSRTERPSGLIFAHAISRVSSVSVYDRRCDQDEPLWRIVEWADHARSLPDLIDRNKIGEDIIIMGWDKINHEHRRYQAMRREWLGKQYHKAGEERLSICYFCKDTEYNLVFRWGVIGISASRWYRYCFRTDCQIVHFLRHLQLFWFHRWV